MVLINHALVRSWDEIFAMVSLRLVIEEGSDNLLEAYLAPANVNVSSCCLRTTGHNHGLLLIDKVSAKITEPYESLLSQKSSNRLFIVHVLTCYFFKGLFLGNIFINLGSLKD